jgi:hypothetical protein
MENTIIKEMLEALDKKDQKAHEQMEAVSRDLAEIAEARARLMKEGKGIGAVIPEADADGGKGSNGLDKLRRTDKQ